MMKKITLTIKDGRRTDFLVELLNQFDFVEIDENTDKPKGRYDFFSSAGLWKNRDINAEQLRSKAWQRSR